MIFQTIISNEKISQSSAVLKFERNFNFIAGQVIGITTNKEIPPRLYSICSAEDDIEIRVLYKIIPTGILTPQLDRLIPGDKIFITEPTGKFIATKDPAYFIASGTGIAPFVSMIRSGHNVNKQLIHGSHNFEDLYFYSELNDNLGHNYIPCCSNNAPNKGIYHGRVTKYLEDKIDLKLDYKYYLCGKAEMVVDTRDLLINKGVPFNNIISEIYF